MSDFLLELGQHRTVRRLVKQVGLPLPMPQALRRAQTPWNERPLRDRAVAYGGATGDAVTALCAGTLVRAGADPFVVGDASAFVAPGEAYGRPPRALVLSEPQDSGDTHGTREVSESRSLPARFHGLVYNATAIQSTAELADLYDFFHPLVARLASCGRVLVLARPPQAAAGHDQAAARSALEGFIRSLAKEIGRRGATAQIVYISDGAEDRLPALLRFLLSERSAFISGQPLHLTARVEAPEEPVWVRPLAGKVALVTGAARGIGAATARRLAAEGAHVVCLDRPQDVGPTSRVARDIAGSVLAVDVTDRDAPTIIADHLKRHRGVDIVVHNAGVTRDKTLARMKSTYWHQAVDINLRAVVRISDALVRDVVRDGGRVICLSSVAGIAGNVGQTNYSASKAGIIGFVASLAAAVAERGITVNAVAPGFIETRLTAAIPTVIREVGRRLSALGQGGLPVDVAEVITFLASPGASGLTGGVIRVCGGAFIGA